MTANRIKVRKLVDSVGTIDRNNKIYEVVEYNIDPDKGRLAWDRTTLPAVGHSGDRDKLVESIIRVRRNNPNITDVSELNLVGDDVLNLLRAHGVEVMIDHKP
jgi:hypothetical protein